VTKRAPVKMSLRRAPLPRRNAPATAPSPLCLYAGGECPRAGRAAFGPPVVRDGAINRAIVCRTCRCRGEESRNTDDMSKPARDLLIRTWGRRD